MAASLTGARYLRDAIVADSAQITGSAEFGGSVTVLSGISGDGSKLTGIASPVTTSSYMGLSGMINRLANFGSLLLGSSGAFEGIDYSPSLNLLVAVGMSGNIQTSSDGGLTWTSRVSPGGTTDNWKDVAWSSSLGRFVAVGYTSKLATSSDGVTWTGATVVWGGGPMRLVWNGAQFLVVGLAFSAVSPDGLTWTVQSWITSDGSAPPWCTLLSSTVVAALTPSAGILTFGIVGYPFPIMTMPAWSPSLGVWAVVVGGTDSGPTFLAALMTSPDGVNWTQRTQWTYGVTGNSFRSGLAWSSSKGIFVMIAPSYGLTSSDGVTWTSSNVASTTLNNGLPTYLEWDVDHSAFVLAGSFNGPVLSVSSDGLNWSMINSPTLNWTTTGWARLLYVSAFKRLFAASYVTSNVNPTIAGCSMSGITANLVTSNATGYFGVNTTTPQQALDVGGLARFQHPAFWAIGSGTSVLVNSTLTYPSTLSNVGNAYSAGFFTCSTTGVHSFTACANVAGGASLQIRKNGNSNLIVSQSTNTGNNYAYVSVSTTTPFAAFDQISIVCSGSGICDSGSTFSGALLFAT